MIQNLDVFLWGQKVGTLVTYKEKYAEKICFYFDRSFLSSGYDIALAERYNIKCANAIIDKAASIVSDYEHYAKQAGVDDYWINQIKEGIGYRIENIRQIS